MLSTRTVFGEIAKPNPFFKMFNSLLFRSWLEKFNTLLLMLIVASSLFVTSFLHSLRFLGLIAWCWLALRPSSSTLGVVLASRTVQRSVLISRVSYRCSSKENFDNPSSAVCVLLISPQIRARMSSSNALLFNLLCKGWLMEVNFGLSLLSLHCLRKSRSIARLMILIYRFSIKRNWFQVSLPYTERWNKLSKT